MIALSSTGRHVALLLTLSLLASQSAANSSAALPTGDDARFGKWQAPERQGPTVWKGQRSYGPAISMPVPRARLSSDFGVRSAPMGGASTMHRGIDLAAALGSPVHAAADGVVGQAGWFGSYGNYVSISHPDLLESSYGHLSRILVRVGEQVRMGQVIGLIGSTGRSTGSHLHYEVKVAGLAVDPFAATAGAFTSGPIGRPLPPPVKPRWTWGTTPGLPQITITDAPPIASD